MRSSKGSISDDPKRKGENFMNRAMAGVFLSSMIMLSGCTTLQLAKDLQAYENKLVSSEQTDTTTTSVTSTKDKSGRDASLLVAFFGLDNHLPRVANKAICEGAGGQDGMPVVFSHEIDFSTLQVGDIRIVRPSGKFGKVVCATLAPADDKGERRTLLLAGEFGSPQDQPAIVEIVGNVLSIDKTVNFKGAKVKATKLEEGPKIVLAEHLPEQDWKLGKKGTRLVWGGGTNCPEGTKTIVRVVWAGGVTKPGGGEADDKERLLYKVRLKAPNGDSLEVTPFALADLNDGDNNHKLCLDVEGTPTSVFFPAGYLTDPRDDLNPETRLEIEQ